MSTTDLGALSAAEKRALLAGRLRAKQRRRRFPASFSQQRLWFLDQLAPGSAAYNVPGAVRIHGPLDLDAWRRSGNEITRRHEALRTTFEQADGQPVQVIAESAEPEFTVVDCAHLRGPDADAAIRELARAEFARPFSLSTGPLLRMRFLRLSPDEHVLLLTMHHIVADLWSTSLAIGEMVLLYEGYRTGREAAVPDLPIQYADYAVWQRRQIEGNALAADLEYWKQALAGAPPALELPTDRPRPDVQGTRGGSRPFRLAAPVADGLRDLGRRENATPFMTLLAAFQVLLHRYGGGDDIVVGVPVANRGRPEIERLIGFFVNTLALRGDLSGGPSFRELLARVRRACLGGYAHQQLPFERLVEELHPRRDLSRSPIFGVSFVFQNIPLPDFDVGGLRLEPFDVDSSTARFDLELQVFDRPDGMAGWFEYNSDLFDAATVDQMSRHLETLAASLVADPGRPVAQVPMRTGEEEDLLRRWNATGRTWPGPLLAHERFAQQAARTPGAEAVRCGTSHLSYGELDRRSNQLARRLNRLGVGPGVLVGICMDRCTDMVVAMLAVLKAGGAYVPLDPGFPPDRIRFMLADSGLPVLLTQRGVRDSLAPRTATVLCTDEIRDELDAEPDGPPGPQAGPGDLAYVIYTSGSTGQPKGVQIPHAALGNFLLAMKERPGIDAGDTLLAVTTLSFDIAMLELLLPLAEGARVVLASRETAADGERLAALLAASGATMMQATPATWRMLLDAGWEGRGGLRALAGGEALPGELAQRLRGKVGTLWNMYGPTETTIWSSVARVGDGPVTLGEPIANTELYILDPAGQPCPLGVPGELYIGGAGLARGYLGRPELTAERFVPGPPVPGGASRLYRTGDLVRRRAGGIEFLGRLDHQVKLRGFRIELGEIESVLERQPAVRHAVAAIREDVPGDQHLVAYVVPAAGQDAGQDAGQLEGWRDQLGQWRRVWDEAYGGTAAGADPALDTRGWNSSYTAQPIPAEQMRDWADQTAGLVLATGPAAVLDVGCGTGLIAYRVAPHCERYWGTDISAVALRRLRGAAAGGRAPGSAEFFECAADELSTLPEQRFDVVVLNSVVQYFPDQQYLLRVLQGALRRLAPGGSVLVGDVRSLPLLECFHASVQLAQAGPDDPPDQVLDRIRRHVAQEEELVIDPRLFGALPALCPEITAVRVMPKRGTFGNEMTRFRYDVLLTVGSPAEPPAGGEWLDWAEEDLTVRSLRDRLTADRPDLLAIANVPNGRLHSVAPIVRRLTGAEPVRRLTDELAAAPPAGAPDPEELYRLGADTGYQIDLDWADHGPDGAFAVVARRRDGAGNPVAALPRLAAAPSPQPPDWDGYVNGSQRRRAGRLLPGLRAALGEQLPDYMIPSAFVFLDALPLTPNGKVDRAALPAPDSSRRAPDSPYVAPRDAVEQVVAGIWAEALGLDRVGVFDDFFALGGHSLLSTRIVARVRDAFAMEVPLHRIFSEPTVAGLSAALRRDSGPGGSVDKTAELLVRLSALSDDQVERALQVAGPVPEPGA